MAAPDRWARLTGVVDLDQLRRDHVVVVGLGSGGSTVALELAKAGVGHLTLVDPDVLEIHNIVRHECDDRDLGKNKAAAVADLIRHRNPDAVVEVVAEDVTTLGADLERLMAGATLTAGCTDAEGPKHLLNRTALAPGVPVVYGGVYERGVGGEIISCAPGGACYACVTAVLKATTSVESAGPTDYGLARPDGTIAAAPGLGVDVRLIALIHAKLCLQALPGAGAVPLAGNVVLFGTAPVEGLFPRAFASAVIDVVPQADCLVCRPYREGGLISAPSPRGGGEDDEEEP